ncbi:TRAM domain-containing protein [Halodesulfurarchaeum sp. HSR-GB]|uniref:TRAM domain-containing protein n=1 Tax=Halodesulfurarchaeum sp. HSR-GB TaxID=3074077 RepID=UPI00285CFB94|nr:TRAM domain-containing protein [Halodesulfurarchaeum sp. HSR-GB]MDR5657013.1 TRAM domain-containing protein [Halodesulfurarchaeum sp. HSR-GB]
MSMDDLLAVFSAEIERVNGDYVISIPERELEVGELDPDSVYRFGVLGSVSQGTTRSKSSTTERSTPPVDEGDTLEVEIDSKGEEGDGIAYVEGGYVVFVPNTAIGDIVTVEVVSVGPRFARAEPVDGTPSDSDIEAI